MGAAANAAQDTPDFEKGLCTVCLDMAAVGAITDQRTGTAAGA